MLHGESVNILELRTGCLLLEFFICLISTNGPGLLQKKPCHECVSVTKKKYQKILFRLLILIKFMHSQALRNREMLQYFSLSLC